MKTKTTITVETYKLSSVRATDTTGDLAERENQVVELRNECLDRPEKTEGEKP